MCSFCFIQIVYHRHLTYVTFHSINAVGVDIAPFSAMSDEEEVLLLPGLPLVNRPGENPEPDLWSFELETPRACTFCNSAMDNSPPVTIDYVHPGTWVCYYVRTFFLSFFLSLLLWEVLIDWNFTMDLSVLTEWSAIFQNDNWRQFPESDDYSSSEDSSSQDTPLLNWQGCQICFILWIVRSRTKDLHTHQTLCLFSLCFVLGFRF